MHKIVCPQKEREIDIDLLQTEEPLPVIFIKNTFINGCTKSKVHVKQMRVISNGRQITCAYFNFKLMIVKNKFSFRFLTTFHRQTSPNAQQYLPWSTILLEVKNHGDPELDS